MNDQELITWLRQNSAGDYRPSMQAAIRIEELIEERANTLKSLQNPLAVMINTNRGTIAKMSDADVKAVYHHLFDEAHQDRNEAIRDAWQIINVLHANAMDHEGEGWKRALDWLSKWEADPEETTTNARAMETRTRRSHALRLEDNRPVKH